MKQVVKITAGKRITKLICSVFFFGMCSVVSHSKEIKTQMNKRKVISFL